MAPCWYRKLRLRDSLVFTLCNCLLLTVFVNFLLLLSSSSRFEQNDNDNLCTESLNRLGIRNVSDNRSREGIDAFLARPIINPFEYSYIFNQSSACSDMNVKFIIAVPSAPRNFEQRTKVRQNRAGKFTGDVRNRAKLLFFLGKEPEDKKGSLQTQKRIENEQTLYGDIVQSTFIDSSRNLTKKAALLLKWSTTFCDHSKFVLRIDDDLRVNLSKMVDGVEQRTKNSGIPHFILGNLVRGWQPVRDKKNKYFTTFEEYPNSTLPDFILGGAMGYSVATADLLLKAFTRLRPFFLDDVFITAMCASKVGVAIHNSPGFGFEHWKW